MVSLAQIRHECSVELPVSCCGSWLSLTSLAHPQPCLHTGTLLSQIIDLSAGHVAAGRRQHSWLKRNSASKPLCLSIWIMLIFPRGKKGARGLYSSVHHPSFFEMLMMSSKYCMSSHQHLVVRNSHQEKELSLTCPPSGCLGNMSSSKPPFWGILKFLPFSSSSSSFLT